MTDLTRHLDYDEYLALAKVIHKASGSDTPITVSDLKGPTASTRKFRVDQRRRTGELAIAYRGRPAISVAGDLIEGARNIQSSFMEHLRAKEIDIMWEAAVTHLLGAGISQITGRKERA